LLSAAILLALCARAAVMLGVAGTLLADVIFKLSPSASASASLSSLDDGARLALLRVGAARTDRGAGVGGTT
jgi:hypothetical protein